MDKIQICNTKVGKNVSKDFNMVMLTLSAIKRCCFSEIAGYVSLND